MNTKKNQITEIIKINMNQKKFINSISTLIDSTCINKYILQIDGEIISFLFYMKRDLELNGEIYKSYSIGLVNTNNKYKGKGYGEKLMIDFKNHALKNKIDILYLQGINKYYLKFDFKRFNNKSKIKVQLLNNLIISSKIKIKKLKYEDLIKLKDLDSSIINSGNLKIKRSSDNWSELLQMQDTFLFFRPKKIIYDKELIGYFTEDIEENDLIKEFVIYKSKNYEYIREILNLIMKSKNLIHLYVCIGRNSKLYNYIESRIDFDYIEFNRLESSNMYCNLMKNQKISEFLSINDFILQGDNL